MWTLMNTLGVDDIVVHYNMAILIGSPMHNLHEMSFEITVMYIKNRERRCILYAAIAATNNYLLLENEIMLVSRKSPSS